MNVFFLTILGLDNREGYDNFYAERCGSINAAEIVYFRKIPRCPPPTDLWRKHGGWIHNTRCSNY